MQTPSSTFAESPTTDLHKPEPTPERESIVSNMRNSSPASPRTSSRETSTPPRSEEGESVISFRVTLVKELTVYLEHNNKLAFEALPALARLRSQKHNTDAKGSGVEVCSGQPHNETLTPRIARKTSQTLSKVSRPSSPCIKQTVLRPVRDHKDEVTTSNHDGKALKRTRSRLCCWSFEDYKRKVYLDSVNLKDQGVNDFGYETMSA